MSAHWEDKSVGEVLRLEYGKPLDVADRKPDGRYPVYGANGEKDRTDKFYYDKPSIIVGRKGSAGEINLTEPKFWPLDVTYFVTFDEHQHDLQFLYYLLTTLGLPSLAKGVKPGINRNEVYSQVTKVPPLPEQQRIVGILDEAFDGITTAKANAEKNLQNARELFQSYLNSVFANEGDGWEVKKLGEILQKTETINPHLNPDKEFVYIDVSSVDNKRFVIENTTLLKGADAPSRARKLIKSGDVIFATVRPTLKRIAIITKEYNGQVCSTGYFVLRAKEQINNKLIFYFLQTSSFNEKMEKIQKGASYPAVTDNEVKGQNIHFPQSLSEQHSIISKLDALSAKTQRLEVIYQEKLSVLEELKKSLLQQAFSGEL